MQHTTHFWWKCKERGNEIDWRYENERTMKRHIARGRKWKRCLQLCVTPLSLSSWRITRMPPTAQGRSNKTRGVIPLRASFFSVRQRQRPIEKCCSNARQVPSPTLMFSLWDPPFLQPTVGIHPFVIGVYTLSLCPLDRWDSIPSFLIVNYRKCPYLQPFNGWYLLGAHYCHPYLPNYLWVFSEN